jgi:hypothetical protein
MTDARTDTRRQTRANHGLSSGSNLVARAQTRHLGQFSSPAVFAASEANRCSAGSGTVERAVARNPVSFRSLFLSEPQSRQAGGVPALDFMSGQHRSSVGDVISVSGLTLLPARQERLVEAERRGQKGSGHTGPGCVKAVTFGSLGTRPIDASPREALDRTHPRTHARIS